MNNDEIATKLAESFAEKNSKLMELYAIVEACPLATFISDRTGSCVYANKAYQILVGRDRKYCLGDQWKKTVHGDDFDAVSTFWNNSVNDSKNYEQDYRLVRPTGEVIPVHVSAVALPSGGFVGYINAMDGANCKFICAAKTAMREREFAAA